MRMIEILAESSHRLVEYGRSGFPGFGMGLFSQRHYQFMVPNINQVSDQHAREWLTNWLSEAFARDNSKFKPSLFKEAVADNRSYGASPKFEQRHFFYFAKLVQEIEDPHIHDFVRDWLADVIGGTNPQFKKDTWNKFCAPAVAKVKETADSALVDEGGPGFGYRGHGGFGQKIFTRAHYLFVANRLGHVDDASVKRHMTNWFSKIFKLDNPAFKAEAFEEAADQPASYGRRPNAVFQQRHFYFLAHEIAEVKDRHERTFLCDWVGDYIGKTNGYFNQERWEKYCHLDDDSSEKRWVKGRRDLAVSGKPEPKYRWQSGAEEENTDS